MEIIMSVDRCLLLALSHLTFGGAERLLARVMTHLRQSGVRLVIAKFGTAHPAYGADVPWFAGIAEAICNLSERAPRPGWADLMIKLIQSHGVTSVAISDSDDAYRMLPVLRAASPSLWICDLHYNPLSQLGNNLRYSDFIDNTIAQSVRTANALIAGGAPPDRVTIIPGGIDVSAFQSPASDRSARHRLGFNGKLVAGYLARFDDTKNPLGFIEVIRRCGGESWGYIVGGGGPLDRDVDAAAARLPAGINRKLLGIVDNTVEFYGLIDVFVATSRNEGRPLAIMESCAMGKPVIATAVGGVPEIVFDGVNGFLCPKDDMAAIAEKLSWFAMHPEELRLMGQQARQIAVAEFDIAGSLPRYARALLGLS